MPAGFKKGQFKSGSAGKKNKPMGGNPFAATKKQKKSK